VRNYKEATQGPTLVDETNIVLGTKKESRVLSEKEEQNPTPFQIQDTNTKGIKQRLAYRNEELPTGLKPRAGLNITGTPGYQNGAQSSCPYSPPF